MSGDSTRSVPEALTPAFFKLLIKQAAESRSMVRRLSAAREDFRRRLGEISGEPSTQEDMDRDWSDACDYAALTIIEGKALKFTQLDPASYPVLEESWLQRVKRLKAYFIWELGGSQDRDSNYYTASNEIRRLLLQRGAAPLSHFPKVRSYIQNKYLKDGTTDRLDDRSRATFELLKRKAHRIYELTHETDDKVNWSRARLYVRLFFENIIGAVEDPVHRVEKTLNVLKAFQFSKSRANRYWIINAFEAAVAIGFLDTETVQKILEKPALYDFSMEPVEFWPGSCPMPNNMSYDGEHKNLIVVGHMSDRDKERLLEKLEHDKHRRAVENLYQQCRLGPFAETFL